MDRPRMRTSTVWAYSMGLAYVVETARGLRRALAAPGWQADLRACLSVPSRAVPASLTLSCRHASVLGRRSLSRNLDRGRIAKSLQKRPTIE